jgi:hypothetical protein
MFKYFRLANNFSQYLDDIELESFAPWAFGEDFDKFDHGLQFMDAWNERHGTKVKLDGNEEIVNDVPRMVVYWSVAALNKPDKG